MITELAEVRVRADAGPAFEKAFATAVRLVREADGCSGVKLLRGVEEPSSYLLIVEWARLEDHTEHFAKSESFSRFIGSIDPFLAQPPSVGHCAEVGTW